MIRMTNKYERNIAKTEIKLGEDSFIMGPIPWSAMPEFMELSGKMSKLKENESALSVLIKEDYETMFNIILEAVKVNEDSDKEEQLKGIITSNFNAFFDGLQKLVLTNDGNK